MVVGGHPVALEAGGSAAAAAGAAQAGVDEELGEGADAELALGLLGEGELSPGLGVGEGSEEAQQAIAQAGRSEPGT
jgi:hypothetical protein